VVRILDTDPLVLNDSSDPPHTCQGRRTAHVSKTFFTKRGIVDFVYLSGRLGRGRAGARVPGLLATRVVA
jgi:hypothetical protein